MKALRIFGILVALFASFPALAGGKLRLSRLPFPSRSQRLTITCGVLATNPSTGFGYIQATLNLIRVESGVVPGMPVTLPESVSLFSDSRVEIGLPGASSAITEVMAGSVRQVKILSEGNEFHIMAQSLDGASLDIRGNTSQAFPAADIEWNGTKWDQQTCHVLE